MDIARYAVETGCTTISVPPNPAGEVIAVFSGKVYVYVLAPTFVISYDPSKRSVALLETKTLLPVLKLWPESVTVTVLFPVPAAAKVTDRADQ